MKKLLKTNLVITIKGKAINKTNRANPTKALGKTNTGILISKPKSPITNEIKKKTIPETVTDKCLFSDPK